MRPGCFLGIACVLCTDAYAQEPTDSVPDFDRYLDEVVVTGTRVGKLLDDTPVQTRLITAREIDRSDATDIQGLLQQEVSGIEFSYAMNQQVHMNFGGFGGQGVLFLVDGERMAGETMDDVDFARVTMNNVERVEIVRGASSALYGSNAGGGVINIITRQPLRPWSLNLDARVGRHAEQRCGLTFANRYRRVGNILSASYSGIDNYDVDNGPVPATRVVATVYGSRTVNISDQFTFTPADGLKLTANAGYFFRQLARVEDSPERYRAYKGGLRGQWVLPGGNDLQLSYGFDQYDKSDYHRLSHLDIRGYSNVQNSVRAMVSHTFGHGDIITAGADYMHDYLMNTKLAGRTRTQENFDVFAQYDCIVSDRWEAVGAVRYDYFSDGRLSRLTPKVSVRYRPARRVNLRFSYGMGFRAPTLKEKYYDFDMAGIWIVKGNRALTPESSHNINLSAEYNRLHYNVTVMGYYNHVRDKITTGLPYSLPGDARQLYLDYVNLAGYSVAGAEVTLRGAWDNGLSARLSYAFTHECAVHDSDGNRANNQYMPARPHSLTFRADWQHVFSLRYTVAVGIDGRFLSSVDNMEYRDYYDISAGMVKVRYPAYTIWKLSCSQTFWKKLKLTVALDNIFNYKPGYYYLNSPLTDGINLLVGVSMNFN